MLHSHYAMWTYKPNIIANIYAKTQPISMSTSHVIAKYVAKTYKSPKLDIDVYVIK